MSKQKPQNRKRILCRLLEIRMIHHKFVIGWSQQMGSNLQLPSLWIPQSFTLSLVQHHDTFIALVNFFLLCKYSPLGRDYDLHPKVSYNEPFILMHPPHSRGWTLHLQPNWCAWLTMKSNHLIYETFIKKKKKMYPY